MQLSLAISPYITAKVTKCGKGQPTSYKATTGLAAVKYDY